MFKKVEGRLSKVSRGMEDVWAPHWISEDEMHNVGGKAILDGINIRWDIAKENITETRGHSNGKFQNILERKKTEFLKWTKSSFKPTWSKPTMVSHSLS